MKQPPKPRTRYAKLDGKPPAKPRGRHTRSSTKGGKHRVVTIPVNQRLGYRVNEWAALTGSSPITVWRHIKAGKIPLIGHGSTKVIPRSYAVAAGYITEDDKI